MRPLLRFCFLACTLFVLAGLAAGSALGGTASKRFYVFKETRSAGVIDVRNVRGKLVLRHVAFGEKDGTAKPCADPRHNLISARWHGWPSYLVNDASAPAEISPAAALADVRAGHEAWQNPFVTDCDTVPAPSPYQAFFGGTTSLGPSLAVNLSFDGANVAAFRSLAGTVCAGAGVVACVVAYSHGGRFVEADMALEADLTALGGDYTWTTDDTTWSGDGEGEFAVVDVATHEWGHFAGLGHVNHSPALTMFPAIHDGMETLGLGDMKGILARY